MRFAEFLSGTVTDTALQGRTLLAGGLAIGAMQPLFLFTFMALLFFLAHGIPGLLWHLCFVTDYSESGKPMSPHSPGLCWRR